MDLSKNWQRCNAHAFWQDEASCSHVVQIYENDAELINLLEGFVTSGIEAGDAVILILSDAHLESLNKQLTLSGLDIDALIACDQYLPFNADEILAKFMVNKWPDYSRFMETTTSIFQRAHKGKRQVRAFGEMVAILWAQGYSAATIMLEQLWNMYCEKDPFSLLCAYPGSSFAGEPIASLHNICKTHTKMIAGFSETSTELAYQNVH